MYGRSAFEPVAAYRVLAVERALWGEGTDEQVTTSNHPSNDLSSQAISSPGCDCLTKRLNGAGSISPAPGALRTAGAQNGCSTQDGPYRSSLDSKDRGNHC